MSKSKSRKTMTDRNSDQLKPERRASAATDETPVEQVWQPAVFQSRAFRRLISVVICGYLLVVMLGPLANPVGSEFLTRPWANAVAPLHRMLFLGHGYRFFGPDPGPGHLVVYRVTDAQEQLTEGRFPDREQHWPRLLYHRWFMLSETIYQEHALTPDTQSFQETDAELEQQIQALRKSKKFGLSHRLEQERERLRLRYERTRERIDVLVSAIADHLLTKFDGRQIELFVQERNIPFPIQVLTGDRLTDDKFLSSLNKIGEFRKTDDGQLESLELPTVSKTPSERATELEELDE